MERHVCRTPFEHAKGQIQPFSSALLCIKGLYKEEFASVCTAKHLFDHLNIPLAVYSLFIYTFHVCAEVAWLLRCFIVIDNRLININQNVKIV